MGDGVTEELGNLFVITSTKMSYWYFANSTLRFSMDFLGKYSFWIGFQCFIISFGHPGLASLLMYLKEMWMEKPQYKIPNSIVQVPEKSILTLRNFGNG